MGILTRIRSLRGLRPLDVHELPEIARSVAIIMDGNGRWARRRGLPVAAGHRAGTRALRRTVEAAIDLGIESLAVYAFSTENWSRPREEIDSLMEVFSETIDREFPDLVRQGVRVRFIGRRDRAPDFLQRKMAGLERQTHENDENVIAANLYAPTLPDPDLLIRTSGELRVSNFLLWQIAYSELVFVDRSEEHTSELQSRP